MNRKERRARASLKKEDQYVRSYVEHLPEIKGGVPEGPGVFHLNVYHDKWCEIYLGNKCNCAPEYRIFQEPNRS